VVIDPTLQYALANMLVNISNSFDKPEITPEQEELKKLGEHVDENAICAVCNGMAV
jgi:hypothetical protein